MVMQCNIANILSSLVVRPYMVVRISILISIVTQNLKVSLLLLVYDCQDNHQTNEINS